MTNLVLTEPCSCSFIISIAMWYGKHVLVSSFPFFWIIDAQTQTYNIDYR